MQIAFLGLGKMGFAMAKRLLAAGQSVVVWNRTIDKAQELAAHGAKVAATPSEAVAHSDLVLTMLFDDAAHEDVLLAKGGVLDAMRAGTLHVSLSTISVELSKQLTEEHRRRSQNFVAAPVFGRPNVAAEGRLWIVIGGDDASIRQARPILERLSRGISVIGPEPRQAHALKLGGNFLISAMIHSLAESFVYAESQGIDPAEFLSAVNSALFQSPFYAAYGNVMLHPPAQPGATVELGAKDLSLLRKAAADASVQLSLAEQMAEVFVEAQKAGLGQTDWAVGQYRMAQRRGTAKSR